MPSRGLGPLIQEVSKLDERRLAACPMVLRICKSRPVENRDEIVEVTVDVADGDYRFRGLRFIFYGFRPRNHRRKQG